MRVHSQLTTVPNTSSRRWLRSGLALILATFSMKCLAQSSAENGLAFAPAGGDINALTDSFQFHVSVRYMMLYIACPSVSSETVPSADCIVPAMLSESQSCRTSDTSSPFSESVFFCTTTFSVVPASSAVGTDPNCLQWSMYVNQGL